MNKLKITLLGSIPKGDKERKSWADWKTEYIEKISRAIPQAKFLHGDLISDNVGPDLVVGHDLWLIKNSDIIIVHATTKIGAGTAQEMVIAKYFQKPLVTVMPKNTHHRRSNVTFSGTLIPDWIHPFIFTSSDYVAEGIDQAILWIKQFLKNPKKIKVKNISIFDDKITLFEKKLSNIAKSYLE